MKRCIGVFFMSYSQLLAFFFNEAVWTPPTSRCNLFVTGTDEYKQASSASPGRRIQVETIDFLLYGTRTLLPHLSADFDRQSVTTTCRDWAVMVGFTAMYHMSRAMKKPDFCLCENKAQVSFAVTAKLISAFVFATRIVHFLFFIKPKFHASSFFLKLYMPVCVRPGRNSRRLVFSRRCSIYNQYLPHVNGWGSLALGGNSSSSFARSLWAEGSH